MVHNPLKMNPGNAAGSVQNVQIYLLFRMWDPEAVFKEKCGGIGLDPMLELIITLFSSRLQSKLSTTATKRRRCSDEGLFYWLGTFVSVC